MEPHPVISRSFDELVFERRNKHYGAYVLRRSYGKTLWLAVMIASSLLLFSGFTSSILCDHTRMEEEADIQSFDRLISLQPPPKADFYGYSLPKPAENNNTTVNVVDSTATQDSAAIATVFDPPTDLFDSTIIITEIGDPIDPIEPDPDIPDGGGIIGCTFGAYPEPTYADLPGFLQTNIQYPADCKAQGIQGSVFVQFDVECDGQVSNPVILRSPHASMSREVLRVMRIMPKWNPGTQNGIAIKTRYTLPVKFTLN